MSVQQCQSKSTNESTEATSTVQAVSFGDGSGKKAVFVNISISVHSDKS